METILDLIKVHCKATEGLKQENNKVTYIFEKLMATVEKRDCRTELGGALDKVSLQ